MRLEDGFSPIVGWLPRVQHGALQFELGYDPARSLDCLTLRASRIEADGGAEGGGDCMELVCRALPLTIPHAHRALYIDEMCSLIAPYLQDELDDVAEAIELAAAQWDFMAVFNALREPEGIATAGAAVATTAAAGETAAAPTLDLSQQETNAILAGLWLYAVHAGRGLARLAPEARALATGLASADGNIDRERATIALSSLGAADLLGRLMRTQGFTEADVAVLEAVRPPADAGQARGRAS